MFYLKEKNELGFPAVRLLSWSGTVGEGLNKVQISGVISQAWEASSGWLGGCRHRRSGDGSIGKGAACQFPFPLVPWERLLWKERIWDQDLTTGVDGDGGELVSLHYLRNCHQKSRQTISEIFFPSWSSESIPGCRLALPSWAFRSLVNAI